MPEATTEVKEVEKVLEGAEKPAETSIGFSSVEGAINHYLENNGQDLSDKAKLALREAITLYAKMAK